MNRRPVRLDALPDFARGESGDDWPVLDLDLIWLGLRESLLMARLRLGKPRWEKLK